MRKRLLFRGFTYQMSGFERFLKLLGNIVGRVAVAHFSHWMVKKRLTRSKDSGQSSQ